MAFTCMKNYIYIYIYIYLCIVWYLKPFIKHFVSWHGHMDCSTCQNIHKEIVWGDEMMGSMLLFMSLTSV